MKRITKTNIRTGGKMTALDYIERYAEKGEEAVTVINSMLDVNDAYAKERVLQILDWYYDNDFLNANELREVAICLAFNINPAQIVIFHVELQPDGSLKRKLAFNDKQMAAIRDGILQDYDVSIYNGLDENNEPLFTDKQMQQIMLGLEEGVDVSLYADPSFPISCMAYIRNKLVAGENVTKEDALADRDLVNIMQKGNNETMFELFKRVSETLDKEREKGYHLT